MTILTVKPLGFPWETADPFLFCVHHLDHYPAGNEKLGPAPELLKGRRIGMDFDLRDGWRMYHGERGPPASRAIRTVASRPSPSCDRGLIDHSDSMGATARFGGGDLQWMTAGDGVVHSEMFPSRRRTRARTPPSSSRSGSTCPPPPSAPKRTSPCIGITSSRGSPSRAARSRSTPACSRVSLGDPLRRPRRGPPTPRVTSPSPPSGSSRARATTLPPARPGTSRTLYFFDGPAVSIAEREFGAHARRRSPRRRSARAARG